MPIISRAPVCAKPRPYPGDSDPDPDEALRRVRAARKAVAQ